MFSTYTELLKLIEFILKIIYLTNFLYMGDKGRMMKTKEAEGQRNPKHKLTVFEEVSIYKTQALKLFYNSSNSN